MKTRKIKSSMYSINISVCINFDRTTKRKGFKSIACIMQIGFNLPETKKQRRSYQLLTQKFCLGKKTHSIAYYMGITTHRDLHDRDNTLFFPANPVCKQKMNHSRNSL